LAGLKKFRRALDLFRRVDLSLAQPLAQFFDRNIHGYDLAGAGEEGIRDSFPDLDAGDAAHHLIKAFEMLDVEGGNYVDAGCRQFLDILIAFAVV